VKTFVYKVVDTLLFDYSKNCLPIALGSRIRRLSNLALEYEKSSMAGNARFVNSPNGFIRGVFAGSA
jgi:hypothetical protein